MNPSFSNFVSQEMILDIRSIPYFKNSIYKDLDIAGTLDFFARRYVKPLAAKLDISTGTALDCAAGYGWFSIAYLLSGGKAAIAVDIDVERLKAAEEIARIFGVHSRMEFIESSIEDISLPADSVDLFVSVETLEHIGYNKLQSALVKIREITSQVVLITTPNKFFPIVAHDTRLPFIHWLPPRYRGTYARLFGRSDMDEGNEFLSPLHLNTLLDKFQPATSCLVFENYDHYKAHFPFYLPYGSNEKNRFHTQPSMLKEMYYKVLSSTLGPYSYWMMPSLARIFLRRR